MKLTDKFLKDKGWKDHDTVIGCHPWANRKDSRARQASCELCKALISAFPVSIVKTKQDRSWHLICLSCHEEIQPLHKIEKHGVIRDNRIIDFD